MTDIRHTEPLRSNPGHVIFIATIAGPVYGTLWLGFGAALYAAIVSRSFSVLLAVLWAIPAIPFGYFLGGLQAFVAGVILAAIAGPAGKFTYLEAFFAALLVGAVAAVVIAVILDMGWMAASFMAAAGCASSITVRAIFHRRFAPNVDEVFD